MSKKLIYISGKISGLSDGNKPKFEEAEKRLREAGYVPINPHKIHAYPPPIFATAEEEWLWYMQTDIKAMMDCHNVAVLDDWKNSKGGTLEVKLALSLGLRVICAHTLKVIESPDEKEMTRVPLKHILKSVKREIGYRRSVYRNLVLSGKMTQEQADHEIKVMEQIHNDYKDLKFVGATTAQPIQSQSQATLFQS